MYQGCNFITIVQGMTVFKDACLVQGNLFGSSGDLCLTSRNNSIRLIPDWSEMGQHSSCNMLLKVLQNPLHPFISMPRGPAVCFSRQEYGNSQVSVLS